MNKGASLAADASRPHPNAGAALGAPGPGVVARRVHTPGMRAPRASPGGRLDTLTWHPYSLPGSKTEDESSSVQL